MLSNTYNPSDTLRASCSGCQNSVTWNINIRNNWTCSKLQKNWACKLSSDIKATASENGASTNVGYYLTPSLNQEITECSCQNWNVTVVGSDGKIYSSETLDCIEHYFYGYTSLNPEPLFKQLSLPPNNKTNTYYNISAKLYSYRKYTFSLF